MSYEERVEKCKNALLREEVLATVESDLGTNNFDLLEYKILPASENPLGFMGDHMKMKVKVQIGDKTQEKNYFVKKIPMEVPEHLEYALKTCAFYKEIEMYKTLFKDLIDAQNDVKNRTKWCPKFYFARETEIFVLEDISLLGFYMIEERTLMDEDHIKATLKTLAAMHASSFVFEEKFNKGEIGHRSPNFTKKGDGKVQIGEIYDHLVFESEATDEPGHPGTLYYQAANRSNRVLVELIPGYTAEERERINKEFPRLIKRMVEMCKPSNKYKNVFVHADPWANNFMYRKDEAGKVECLLIDFQMVRYGPPAHDIMMLLNLVQSKAFIKEKQPEMLKYYYEVFTEELAKNGLDAKKLFPWDVLVESCDYYYELGSITAAANCQLLYCPSDIIGKFLSSPELFTLNMSYDRSELVRECYLKDEICRTRMIDDLDDVIKKYILI